MTMATTKQSDAAFTEEERAAMKEHAAEVKRARSTKGTKAEKAAAEAAAVVEKIAAMPEPDKGLAERIHRIALEVAPDLAPRLWYGMPAYAKDGKVVFFFQDAAKFKARYATLGFQDPAQLDDGSFWPTSWAVTPEFSEADEATVAELIRRAVA
ncbi:iron chaperone [Curtobacterium pusillum]